MPRQTGTLKLSGNIEPLADAPLDARSVVPALADLTAAGTFPYHYRGMRVSVAATGQVFVLAGDDPTQTAAWSRLGQGGGDYNTIKLSDIDKLFVKTP